MNSLSTDVYTHEIVFKRDAKINLGIDKAKLTAEESERVILLVSKKEPLISTKSVKATFKWDDVATIKKIEQKDLMVESRFCTIITPLHVTRSGRWLFKRERMEHGANGFFKIGTRFGFHDDRLAHHSSPKTGWHNISETEAFSLTQK